MILLIKRFIRQLYLLLTLFLLSFNSCVEKIDIKLDDSFTRLVVEGSVTSDSVLHWVKLGLTSNYFNNQGSPFVSGATVTLSDGNAVWHLFEHPTYKGSYYSAIPFKGEVGKNYSIQVSNVEIGGESKACSANCSLPDNGRLDSISIVEFAGFDYWIIKLYAQDPPDVANFYMFNVYRNGELMTDTIQNVTISNDILFDGNYTNGIQVQFFQKNKVITGDTITLEMAGITKEYYKFLEALKTEAGYHNPLFDGPPANVIGNISNGALGFFAAQSLARTSAIIPSSKKHYTNEAISPFIKNEILQRR